MRGKSGAILISVGNEISHSIISCASLVSRGQLWSGLRNIWIPAAKTHARLLVAWEGIL